MTAVRRLGLIHLFGIGLLVGCGGNDEANGPAAKPTGSAATAESNPHSDAIAKAASDFLEAVIKGDPQRASARLTPQAIERLVASEVPFNPRGVEGATFRIGEVRTPSQNQALVQCVLSYTTADGKPQGEELCCLLRHIENDWRVSGLAYGTGPNKPWMLSDFETGQTTTIARQASSGAAAQSSAANTPAGGRPSPPRTAELASPDLR
jgi:hypothetical protein